MGQSMRINEIAMSCYPMHPLYCPHILLICLTHHYDRLDQAHHCLNLINDFLRCSFDYLPRKHDHHGRAHGGPGAKHDHQILNSYHRERDYAYQDNINDDLESISCRQGIAKVHPKRNSFRHERRDCEQTNFLFLNQLIL